MTIHSFVSKVKLNTEVTTLAPSEIEAEVTLTIRNKWKAQPLIFANSPVPTAARIEHLIGTTAGALECFVGNAYDVKIEIMRWVPPIPFRDAMLIVWAVIFRRQWIVGVSEPELGIPFLRMFEMDVVGHDDFMAVRFDRGKNHQKNAEAFEKR